MNSYDGHYVLEIEPNDVQDLTGEYQRALAELDNQTGRRARIDINEFGFTMQQFTWFAKGRAENRALREFFYLLKGRLVPVWLPTFYMDFELTEDITDDGLRVKRCGYTDLGGPLFGRDRILIWLHDGTRYYRTIIGSSLIGGGETEFVQMDSVLPADVPKSAVRRISFLALARLNQDTIEIVHHADTKGLSTVSAIFLGDPGIQFRTAPIVPPSGYVTHAISINPDFDYLDTFLPIQEINVTGFSGLADSSLFTICFWINPAAEFGYLARGALASLNLNRSFQPYLTGGPSDPYADPRLYSGISIGLNDFVGGPSPSTQYSIEWDCRGIELDLGGNGANLRDYFHGHTDSIPIDGNYHCVRLSIDVNHNAGGRLVSASVDGSPVGVTVDNDYGLAFQMPFGDTTADRLCLFNTPVQSGGTIARTSIAALWISTNEYVTDDNIFRDSETGKPIDLGDDGSVPTGTAPSFYFDLKSSTSPDDFLSNRGSAGGSGANYTCNFVVGGCTTASDTEVSVSADFDPNTGDVWLYSYDYDSHVFPAGTSVLSYDSGTTTIVYDNPAGTLPFTPTFEKLILGTIVGLTLSPSSPSD